MDQHIFRDYDRINQLFKQYNHIYHKLAVNADIADSVFDIYYALLWKDAPCTPTDITDFSGSSKQTIHSALKKLEAEGEILIEVSPENRRNRLVSLTDKGYAKAHASVQPVMDAEYRSFASLTPEERETLIRIQTKQLAAFQNEAKKILSEK